MCCVNPVFTHLGTTQGKYPAVSPAYAVQFGNTDASKSSLHNKNRRGVCSPLPSTHTLCPHMSFQTQTGNISALRCWEVDVLKAVKAEGRSLSPEGCGPDQRIGPFRLTSTVLLTYGTVCVCVCVALGQRLSEVTVSHTAVERTGPRVQRVWKVNGRKERGFHLDGVTFHWGESLTPFVRKTEKSERTFFPLLLAYYAYCVRALWGKLEKLMSWIISHNGSWQDNYTSLV